MKVFREFRVGRFTCEMTYEHGKGLRAEWTPIVPRQGDLTAAELDQYRAGRHVLMTEVAEKIGGNVLVVE